MCVWYWELLPLCCVVFSLYVSLSRPLGVAMSVALIRLTAWLPALPGRWGLA